jgi:hypothetical protein
MMPCSVGCASLPWRLPIEKQLAAMLKQSWASVHPQANTLTKKVKSGRHAVGAG